MSLTDGGTRQCEFHQLGADVLDQLVEVADEGYVTETFDSGAGAVWLYPRTTISFTGREKMARVAVCLALIAPAAGLVAPAAPAASTALKAEAAASLKGMSGGVQAGDPMPGEGPWDPIGFSKLHENIQGSEHAGVVPSQQWMREAEIKHGICAELTSSTDLQRDKRRSTS